MKWYSYSGKQLGSFYIIKYSVTIWLSDPSPRYVLWRMEDVCSQKTLYVNVSNSSVCKHPNWKQLSILSMDEWINQLWIHHTMVYYSAIKRNKLLIRVATWIELKGCYAEWKKQSQKISYYRIQFLWHFGKEKTIARTDQCLPCVKAHRTVHHKGIFNQRT